MRRPALILLIAVAAVVAAGLTACGSGDSYRVDAIFDTADGMVAGQVVKIAGARVGSLEAVHLTPDLRARMELSIDPRFAHFHADATCHILPEGLISENYVECDPGSPSAPPLADSRSGVPTVPVTHTTEPVSVQQMLDIFSLPTRDRLQILLDELGIATSGRGEDVNALLRRANPALAQARRVLATLDRQRNAVGTAVEQTDVVVGQLAAGRRGVRRFVTRSASVLRTAADHRGALSAAVGRLPALLSAVRGSFTALDGLATQAPPLLSDLQAAAPGLGSLTDVLPRFTSVGTPAVRAVGAAAREGITAARTADLVVRRLDTFTSRARPTATLLNRLFVSMQQRGAIEGLLTFIYSLTSVGGMYDGLGHVAGIDLVLPPCIGDQTYPGCDANYHRLAVAAAADRTRPHRPHAHRAGPSEAAKPGAAPAATAAGSVASGGTPPGALGSAIGRVLAPVPTAAQSSGLLRHLLGYLLK